MAGLLDLGREELEDRLRECDRAVALLYPHRSFRLVLVGGGAMVLLGCLARSTADLDALQVPPELITLMGKYDINSRVSAYLDHFAYNLEDRLVLLSLGTTAIECYAASLEDVVASKLYSDRETDAHDIRRPEVLEALDWERLAAVATDMRGSMMNERRYSQFLYNYKEYRKELGPCDT
ncbi:MAG: DUF6036 family nucleotidyltransferase [Actinomycetota bacterium]|jgi:hypothetical protein|nr:DUF6036 family nucleotidyltransferase [Actinomycetota bacterium]